MEGEVNKNPQQNVFYFDCVSDEAGEFRIRFNSVFDSGNLLTAQQTTPNYFILQTAPDCYGTEYEGFTRSWFHFGVSGVPLGVKITFLIKRIHILYSLYKSAPESYKPVYKIGNGRWNRLEDKSKIIHDAVERTLDVEFSYTFQAGKDEEVFFAFSYPFSYTECTEMLDKLQAAYSQDPDLYFHRELFTKTPQNRNIELLTISSHEGKLNSNESYINDLLFPNRETEQRAYKFRANKPVVLLTARVHPGETPSSHSMNGILKFLLDKRDIRAYLLRKYFVFMIVPMINPDGVAAGHYRMDIYHHNLNRHYKNPDPVKQPMIFAIKELVGYLNSENRLFFYCDLHAHAAKKGSFLYGNALDFVMQVESMLFAKVMSLNCINFEYESCNFSKKHMNARDRGEKLTKEGAGRVYVYKTCNIIHSYTLECGFHYSNHLSPIVKPSTYKPQPNLPRHMSCCESEVTNIESDMYKETPVYYTMEIYEDVGKAMLVSILDIFQKNPATRITNSPYGSLENIRKEIALKTCKFNRFKKDAAIRKKCNKINELVQEVFYEEFAKKNVFDKPKVVSAPKKVYSENRFVMKITNESPSQSSSKVRNFFPTKFQTLTIKESATLESSAEDQNDDVESSEERSVSRMNKKPSAKPKLKPLVPVQTKELPPPKTSLRSSIKFQKLQTQASLDMQTYDSPASKVKQPGMFEVYALEPARIEERGLSNNPLTKSKKFQQKPKAEAKVDTRNPYGIDKKIPMKNPTVKLPDLRSSANDLSTFNSFFMVVGGKNMQQIASINKLPRRMEWGSTRLDEN